MARSALATLRFFLHLARDLVGTLRARVRRRFLSVVNGRDQAVVGVDIFPFFEKMTGVGWYEWNLLAALDRSDHGIKFNLYGHTFLAPNESPPPPLPGSRHMRMRLPHPPVGVLLPLRPAIRFLRAVVEPMLRMLDGNDVLFAPNYILPDSLTFAPTAVATVHDLAFAVMPNTVEPVTLARLRQHLPEILFRSSRLIAVSDATAEDMVEHLEISRRRIHTVHEGLDPSFADDSEIDQETAEDDPLPDRYLLFVSTLEPRKNVVGILRAFKLLVDWGYPGELLLVGRWGWRTAELGRELAGSPVGDQIRHLDYVGRSQLPRLYRHADALLFPSLLEGFGLPLLEAMACGTPVVTSGQSAMPEVAGPAAVYVDPASPHGMASAIASLLSDPSHRDRLVKIGRERAAKFSWDHAAAATAQTLRQAAGLSVTGEDEYRV